MEALLSDPFNYLPDLKANKPGDVVAIMMILINFVGESNLIIATTAKILTSRSSQNNLIICSLKCTYTSCVIETHIIYGYYNSRWLSGYQIF